MVIWRSCRRGNRWCAQLRDQPQDIREQMAREPAPHRTPSRKNMNTEDRSDARIRQGANVLAAALAMFQKKKQE